jgi:RimJ/RimL family protein N-acetyltransferase
MGKKERREGAMEFQKEPVIRTARLVLRAMEERDQQAMLDMLTHPQVGKTYMVPQFASREEALPLFQRLQGISNDVSRFFYGIQWQDRMVGMIHVVESVDQEAELGYAIHPDYWGIGIATEALGACMEALYRAGYEMVCAGAFDHNPASMRVMEKCGMVLLDKEEMIPYRGKDHRCVYYGKRK